LASFILVKEKQRLKVKWKRLLTTCKRRIPYLCERYSIKSLSEAQKILNEVISFYNEERVHEETNR